MAVSRKEQITRDILREVEEFQKEIQGRLIDVHVTALYSYTIKRIFEYVDSKYKLTDKERIYATRAINLFMWGN